MKPPRLRPLHATDNDTLHLTPCFACIFSRVDSQPMIDFINASYPLPRHLRHLKRIRPLVQKATAESDSRDDNAELQMLIAPTEGLTEAEWLDIYACPSSPSLDANNLASALKARMQVVEVPTHMPKTRSAWEQQRAVWPMSFHHHMRDKRQHDEQALLEEVLSKMHQLPHDGDEKGLLSVVTETGEVVCQVEAVTACTSPRVLEHPVMLLVKRKAAIDSRAAVLAPESYLCTGLIGILPFEPCLMCAMALTHSRIRAVVVASTATKDGPWSQHGLHQLRGLNHHYHVYAPLCET